MKTLTVRSCQRARRRQRGFTLIEIMVGMVIALVAVIIMTEVLITTESNARSTTSGNDATSNGAVMMHLMQHDLLQAGFGLNSLNLMGCNLTLPNGTVVPMAPVVINPVLPAAIPAQDANTDVVLVMYGSDNGQPQGNAITLVSGSNYTVQAPTAFNVNDYVVAVPASCATNLTLAQVTGFAPAPSTALTVNTVQAGATTLFNMGQAPRVVGYMVRSGSLTSCDFMATDCTNALNWVAVAGNIVSLRAQYGRDTSPVGSMTGYVSAWDQTTPTTSCTWARATAVRFALVARSNQYETKVDATTGQRVCNAVTTSTPTWSGSTGTSAAPFVPPFNGSTASDWQCYRYKTFENVAPNRNIVWMGAQAGC